MGSLATDGVTLTVEIAFATADPFAVNPTWVDVSAYVRGVSIRRGRWQELSTRADAGTCVVRLDNSTRLFDPLNTAGTYYPNVVPMKQIRVRATYSAVVYNLFRGYIDEWPQTWTKGNGGTVGLGVDSEATITCTDPFALLANCDVPDRYAMEVFTDDPVGYWRCDDSGDEMVDSGPSGFHGSWLGNTVSGNPMRFLHDGGRQLNGSAADQLDLATRYNESTGTTGDQIIQSSATSGSLECWIYIGDTSQGGVQYLESGLAPVMSIIHDSEAFGAGTIVFSWQNVATTVEGSIQIHVPPGQPLHVVGTYNHATNTATLYLNGIAYTFGAGSFGDFETINLLASGIFVFNSLPAVDETARAFTVSDIALYNTVLTQARVTAHYLAGKTGKKTERTGDRVEAILDSIDWPSGRRLIGEGDSWLDVGPVPSTVLDYLQQIAETEQGRLHISGQGEVVFRDRTDDLTRTSSSTSQATFGDSGSELRYSELVLDGGHITSIRNIIKVTPQSGVTATLSTGSSEVAAQPQISKLAKIKGFLQGIGTLPRREVVSSTVKNTASVAAYGPRVEAIASLHANQGDARNLGLWRLEKFADPQIVVRQLTFKPRRSPSTLFVQALDRDLGNRITVVRRPQGVGSSISQERTIEGIEHTLTPDDWTVTWYLCQPTPSISEGTWLLLDDATRGRPNGTNLLPY